MQLAHEHGARFGYIITSKAMPLLDLIAEAGVDVVIGVDPREWDLARTKAKIGDRVCLWGGVNGHLTVEQGSEEEVHAGGGPRAGDAWAGPLHPVAGGQRAGRLAGNPAQRRGVD